ncbi:MAG: hypothetical protein M0Z51_15820 [Propionibacterium sp.]|nr:hypothetical protein [Propionibacterium sp.]
MLASIALTMVLLAGSDGDAQAAKRAAKLVKDIEPGAAAADVETRTAPLGSPTLVFQRCSASTSRCEAAQEKNATKRTATWEVGDRKLIVTYCGRADAWRMAAMTISSADHIQLTGTEPAALVWKYNSDLMERCAPGKK